MSVLLCAIAVRPCEAVPSWPGFTSTALHFMLVVMHSHSQLQGVPVGYPIDLLHVMYGSMSLAAVLPTVFLVSAAVYSQSGHLT